MPRCPSVTNDRRRFVRLLQFSVGRCPGTQLRADGTLEIRADNTGPSKQQIGTIRCANNAGFYADVQPCPVEQVIRKGADSFTTTLQV